MDNAFVMPLNLIPPPSPCQGICQLADETCLGCGRLIGEIIEWPSATADRKTHICLEASKRLAILQLSPATGNHPS